MTVNGYMTKEYASLEQMLKKPSNLLCDEWAIGVLFYKLLANDNHPFDVAGKSHEERIKIMQTQEIKFP